MAIRLVNKRVSDFNQKNILDNYAGWLLGIHQKLIFDCIQMKILIEETGKYFDSLKQDIKRFQSKDEQAFGIRVSCLQKALIDAFTDLGYHEEKDFRIGWDWDNSYLLYGTLINKSIISPALVDSVLKVFSGDKDPSAWVCLLHVEKKDALVGSQFYIKANRDIVIEKDIEWYEIECRLKFNKTGFL